MASGSKAMALTHCTLSPSPMRKAVRRKYDLPAPDVFNFRVAGERCLISDFESHCGELLVGSRRAVPCIRSGGRMIERRRERSIVPDRRAKPRAAVLCYAAAGGISPRISLRRSPTRKP